MARKEAANHWRKRKDRFLYGKCYNGNGNGNGDGNGMIGREEGCT